KRCAWPPACSISRARPAACARGRVTRMARPESSAAKDLVRPLATQRLRHAIADLLRVGPVRLAAQNPGAIRGGDQGAQMNSPGSELGKSGQRQRAAAAERAANRTLGAHA